MAHVRAVKSQRDKLYAKNGKLAEVSDALQSELSKEGIAS